MPRIFIDGKPYEAKSGQTVMQVARENGAESGADSSRLGYKDNAESQGRYGRLVEVRRSCARDACGWTMAHGGSLGATPRQQLRAAALLVLVRSNYNLFSLFRMEA